MLLAPADNDARDSYNVKIGFYLTLKWGLSFSAKWQHLKDKYKLKKKWSSGNPVDVHWVLENCKVPKGLKFVIDEKDKEHAFLTVEKKMTTIQLRTKLLDFADRMSVIREVQDAL